MSTQCTDFPKEYNGKISVLVKRGWGEEGIRDF